MSPLVATKAMYGRWISRRPRRAAAGGVLWHDAALPAPRANHARPMLARRHLKFAASWKGRYSRRPPVADAGDPAALRGTSRPPSTDNHPSHMPTETHLAEKERDGLLTTMKARFNANMHRHAGL